MHDLSLDLFVVPGMRQGLPDSARVFIAVTPVCKEEGHLVVTNECRSLKELDEEITRLERELDAIRKRARKVFAR